MKLCHMRDYEVGMTTYVQIFGACIPEILEGQKVENSARNHTTSSLTSNILETYRDIKNRKQTGSSISPLGSAKKNW